METSEVIIVGGGLAGLTAAIHLLGQGCRVVVFEKNEFPKHKVCGEYVSNEVVPYLKSLELDVEVLGPRHIDKLTFSLRSGKSITTGLPLGGFGISRYALDHYLYQEVKKRGGIVIRDTVTEVVFSEDKFRVVTSNDAYYSKVVLGAFGKRSSMDITLHREFIKKPSNWLGVKAHYQVDYPDDLVGLHHFNGGYCGISKVESDLVNICYLGNYQTFKQYKNIQDYQQQVVCRNPHLKAIFKRAVLQFDHPLTISQISFEPKSTIENHILMIGDTAGFIHPLCGNGMAMAIHSAKLASEAVIPFLKEKWAREKMEQQYAKNWTNAFRNRLKTGRRLAYLLQSEKLSAVGLQIVVAFPFLLSRLIKNTHGRPI